MKSRGAADQERPAGLGRRRFLGLAASGLGLALAAPAALMGQGSFELTVKGQELLASGQARAALEPLHAAMALDPANVWIISLLGRAHARLGQRAEALEAFRGVLRLSPGDTYARMMVDQLGQWPLPDPANSAQSRPGPDGLGGGREGAAAKEREEWVEKGGTRRGLVVVDPGHGGIDPGLAERGLPDEKEITLAVGLELARSLGQQGVETAMARNGDYLTPPGEGAAMANRLWAGLLLSLHLGRAGLAPGGGTGFCGYAPDPSDDNAALSAEIENGFLARFRRPGCPFRLSRAVNRLVLAPGRGRYWRAGREAAAELARDMAEAGSPLAVEEAAPADFQAIAEARCPAVHVRLGCLGLEPDRAALTSERGRRELAQAIARAAAQYLEAGS